MAFLLDTHALIWWLEGDERFPITTREQLLTQRPVLWVSTVSFWEISIKRSIGKLLDLSQSTEKLWDEARKQGFVMLQIDIRHLNQLEQLPFHHRDPFDRLLIAQAQVEDLTVLTRDAQFDAYEVPVR